MNTRDTILAGLSALFLLGTGVRLAREAETPRVIWPEIPSAVAAPPRAEGSGDATRVALAGNVFSATRQAPPTRFRPGAEAEMMAETSYTNANVSEPAYVPPPPPLPQYRVAGTMLTRSGGMALIDADPSSPQPEVYRQGDAVGGYRLEKVAYDHVVLVGAGGEIRLDVAKPGETPRVAQTFTGPPPNAGPDPNPPKWPKAKSSKDTPPGAIPPGW